MKKKKTDFKFIEAKWGLKYLGLFLFKRACAKKRKTYNKIQFPFM